MAAWLPGALIQYFETPSVYSRNLSMRAVCSVLQGAAGLSRGKDLLRQP